MKWDLCDRFRNELNISTLSSWGSQCFWTRVCGSSAFYRDGISQRVVARRICFIGVIREVVFMTHRMRKFLESSCIELFNVYGVLTRYDWIARIIPGRTMARKSQSWCLGIALWRCILFSQVVGRDMYCSRVIGGSMRFCLRMGFMAAFACVVDYFHSDYRSSTSPSVNSYFTTMEPRWCLHSAWMGWLNNRVFSITFEISADREYWSMIRRLSVFGSLCTRSCWISWASLRVLNLITCQFHSLSWLCSFKLFVVFCLLLSILKLLKSIFFAHKC